MNGITSNECHTQVYVIRLIEAHTYFLDFLCRAKRTGEDGPHVNYALFESNMLLWEGITVTRLIFAPEIRKSHEQ